MKWKNFLPAGGSGFITLAALALISLPSVGEAAGEQLGAADIVKTFIELNAPSILFLFVLGFLGGLISGFIGSGGAFVLTPGMMSLGVPGAVAVATNMCHKFPKALVGAFKRYKYGQVDVKLGLIMGVSATVGVQIGIGVQKLILATWGPAGSNLYVSLVFVTILTVLGLFIFSDAVNTMRGRRISSTSNLAGKVSRIKIPPVLNFPVAGTKTSVWVTVPLGLATGMLAATIAVGGFIGVPGMIYVLGAPAIVASATELVIAFVMGLSGSINWAMGGFVDIRLVVLILAGSLIGVQLGAVGTTYVKEYMIKFVMSTIMLVVAVSRGFAIPAYLHELGVVQLSQSTIHLLKNTSFVTMCGALAAGGVIVLGSMIKGRKQHAGKAAKDLPAAQYDSEALPAGLSKT
ncbi:MAG: sulfite exporter TauE/SafE family protein [Peptococcaceae bacterium]|nr:sulfite exporter TauE/SafE family protein [Peptococcaceae bacterium]